MCYAKVRGVAWPRTEWNLATQKVVQLVYYDRWGTKLSPTTLFNMISTYLVTHKVVQLVF